MIARLKKERTLVVAATAVVIIGLVIGLLTDTIRLGPSEVALPADAMFATLEIIQIPSFDRPRDYYYVFVTVSNYVEDPMIQPYEATVTLETNADIITHWPPVADDDGTPYPVSFPIIDRTFTFPAGVVKYDEPAGTGRWTALGESWMKSRPIFENAASFLLEVAVGKGTPVSASSVVHITWYYHSAVQAYPVASRTITIPTLLIPSGQPST